MKIVIATLIVVVMGVIVSIGYNEEVIAVNPQKTATSTVEQVEVDVIDSAQAELDRINNELDQEETNLLLEIEQKELKAKAEIETIKTKAEAEIETIKVRIEKLQETRSSFQSPRGLTE